jgi:hypothetical protein
MKGPTMRRVLEGGVRRTEKPPKSRGLASMMTVAVDAELEQSGSAAAVTLMAHF